MPQSDPAQGSPFFRWETGCQCPPVPLVRSCHIQFAVSQPAWPWHSPGCDHGHWWSPLTCWFSVQLNPVLAAVIIPVLNTNTSLINTCFWGFVFGSFWFMDSLLSLHNKAQCIFQGLVTSVYSQPHLTYRVLRPHRAGEGGCKDLTALAFLLLPVGIWSDLGLPGIPWGQTQSPVSNLSHVPRVRAARGRSTCSCSWSLQKQWWKANVNC